MGRTRLATLIFAGAVLASAPASADSGYRYLGPHAVGTEHGSFCTIRARHSHAYEPDDAKVFRVDGGIYVFIGDPRAHGYRGRHFTFYGHHPVPGVWGGHWCFIDGPHSHFYRPVRAHFRYQGGSYYYVGAFTDPWYVRNRTVYEPVLAHHYAGRSGYVRPTITVAPPSAYVGPRVVVSAAHPTPPVVQVRRPAVHVSRPAAHVSAPAAHVSRPAAHVSAPAAHVSRPAAHVSAPAVHVSAPVVHNGPGVRAVKPREAPNVREVKTKDGPPAREAKVKASGPQGAQGKAKKVPHGPEVKAKKH